VGPTFPASFPQHSGIIPTVMYAGGGIILHWVAFQKEELENLASRAVWLKQNWQVH